MFTWKTRQRKLRISSYQVYFVTFLLDIQVLTSLNLFKIRARRGTKSRDLGQVEDAAYVMMPLFQMPALAVMGISESRWQSTARSMFPGTCHLRRSRHNGRNYITALQ